MKTNPVRSKVTPARKTHGGAPGAVPQAEEQLLRLVASCMLYEKTFYESGDSVVKNIAETLDSVSPEYAAKVAIMAREDFKLRHVPLFLLSQLAYRASKRKKTLPAGVLSNSLARVIQRADELAEFLAIHAKVNGVKPDKIKKIMSAQIKQGLAQAFTKFDAYRLAKYNRDNAIKLRDVLFLCHAKPKDKAQANLWKKLVEGTLASPDTWEVALSGGADKKLTFERLLADNKLGDLALLRNLRNMKQAGVPASMIKRAIADAKFTRVLPFRFIAAAKYAPEFEDALGEAMVRSMIADAGSLSGRTLLVVDISGSMHAGLSGKSEMTRLDAACGLAMLIREVCEEPVIYATAGNDWKSKHATDIVPPRHAFALRDAILKLNSTLGQGGIFLKQCIEYIDCMESEKFDRVIVITDEQDCDNRSGISAAARNTALLGKHNYILNVAPYKVGLDTGEKWVRFNGFSERVVDFIRWFETKETPGQFERKLAVGASVEDDE